MQNYVKIWVVNYDIPNLVISKLCQNFLWSNKLHYLLTISLVTFGRIIKQTRYHVSQIRYHVPINKDKRHNDNNESRY